MKTTENCSLAKYTSLNVGGIAKKAVFASTPDEVVEAIHASKGGFTVLGFGCNVVVSDKGLPGTTVLWREGTIAVDGEQVVVSGGVWWDDVVKSAIEHGLWGLELMSEIPSSVGGAIFGNIAAYGQQVSDTLSWVRVLDTKTGNVEKHDATDFTFRYRGSSFQTEKNLVILEAGFTLSKTPLHELTYDSAINVGEELGLNHRTLEDCRKIIIETRRRAGSIYHFDDPNMEHTAGSFFKNPLVPTEQAKELASFDESGKTLERILHQAQVHGGDTHRASAAHVMLAAGFNRGDTWGHVRLHPSHVLKLQTLEGATATEVYDVVQMIVRTVKEKTGIDLEPEVKFVGEF